MVAIRRSNNDPALADAILDRLIHSSHKLALKGESMRKVKNAKALKQWDAADTRRYTEIADDSGGR